MKMRRLTSPCAVSTNGWTSVAIPSLLTPPWAFLTRSPCGHTRPPPLPARHAQATRVCAPTRQADFHAMTPESHQSVIAVCHVRTPLDKHPDDSPLMPSIWPVQQRLGVIALSPVTLRCCNAIKEHATSSPRFHCSTAMPTITTHYTRPQPSTPSLMQEAVGVGFAHLGPA